MKPVFDKIDTVSHINVASHAADASLVAAPRRLLIRGTIFSDFYPELVLDVWKQWVAFTESSEDVRTSAILFDLTHPEKPAQVKSTDTAFAAREPNYWIAIQGRTTSDASLPAVEEFTARTVKFVREKNTELSGADLGWFLSMCRGDENSKDVFGANLRRLRACKAKFDSMIVWKKGIVITPLHE